MKAIFDDFYNLFYVSVYGANKRCQEEIEKVFYESREHTKSSLYQFFEYFLSTPLPRDGIAQVNLDNILDNDVFLLAPFAPRLLENSLIIPKIKEEVVSKKIGSVDINLDDVVEFEYRSDEIIKDMKLAFQYRQLLFTHSAYIYWKSKDILGQPTSSEDPKLLWKDLYDNELNQSYSFGKILDWTPRWQITKYINEKFDSTIDDFTLKSRLQLAGFFKEIFSNKLESKVSGIFLPIASSNYFYGAIWLMFPSLDHSKNSDIIDSFVIRISRLIDKHYLPALTLLHEHWLESKVSNVNNPQGELKNITIEMDLSEKIKVKCFNFFEKKNLTSTDTSSSSHKTSPRKSVKKTDDIEKKLQELWEYRTSISKNEFYDTLIFKNYLTVSEKMSDCLYEVINSSQTMGKRNDTLPACLIIGSAGSGKEKLAKLIKLFSNNYKRGEDFVVNLASIRPAPLTSSVMVGSEIGDNIKFKLKGILSKIFESKSCGINRPTLILDEFNSMDPDSQGILLRFLDNSEIIPLGSIQKQEFTNGMFKKKKELDCLVIGIMNEDPDDISRETALEFFKNNPYLGGLFSDLLYEHFIKIRRLRPDIKYRMIRNGKFIIPPLKDRIEDIPLMFYIFIREELKAIAQSYEEKGEDENENNYNVTVHLTLPVLNRLSAKDLKWQGNVRQLQALSKVVGQGVWSRQSNSCLDGKIYNFNIYSCDLNEGLVKVNLC